METTPYFANRSSIVRIRKRPRDYAFAEYPEGDVLGHIKRWQPYCLGCVFSVVRAWLEAGKPGTNETRHHFRDWCQILDWIVQHILGEAPLMDGHDAARQRVSNTPLSFARKVAIAIDQDTRLGDKLTAKQIYD